MMAYHHGGQPLMWMGLAVFWAALIVVIAWLVLLLVKDSRSRTAAGAAAPSADALDVLDRRLAAGEIDVPTYEATRAALLSARAPAARAPAAPAASAPTTRAPQAPTETTPAGRAASPVPPEAQSDEGGVR